MSILCYLFEIKVFGLFSLPLLQMLIFWPVIQTHKSVYHQNEQFWFFCIKLPRKIVFWVLIYRGALGKWIGFPLSNQDCFFGNDLYCIVKTPGSLLNDPISQLSDVDSQLTLARKLRSEHTDRQS